MQNEKLLQVLQDLTQKVNNAADRAGEKMEDFINNENALRPILFAAYSRLPFFIRMLLKEERFVEFVFQNKEKLLLHRQVGQIVGEMMDRFLKK